MKPQKILIMLPGDQLGGAEQFLKMIAVYYANIGFDIHVYFGSKEKHRGWHDVSIDKGIKLYYGKSNNALGLIYSYFFLSKFKKEHFHMAFSSNIYYNGLLGFYKKIGILKVDSLVGRESTSIFTRYSGLKLNVYKFFYWLGYKQIDLLICQTDFMKQQLVNGIPKITGGINIKILHNPINLDGADKQDQELSLFNSSRKYIVAAGRLIPEKGYDILIKAYHKISAKYGDVDLLILGEGRERTALQVLVNLLVMDDRVIMPGRVDNIYPYFKNAELCVISSRIEGFPNTLLQMMSQNPNVISTICVDEVKKISSLPVCNINNEHELAALMEESLNDTDVIKQTRYAQFQAYLKKNNLDAFVKQLQEYLVQGK